MMPISRNEVPSDDDAVTADEAAALMGADSARFVWRNDEGGLTFVSNDTTSYMKWVPAGNRAQLYAATARANWVRPYVTTPRFGPVSDDAGGSWVTSAALPGAPAMGPWGKAHPLEAVRAIAKGQRLLHDSAPVASYPFEWSLEHRLARAKEVLATRPGWRAGLDDYFDSWTDEAAAEVLASDVAEDLDLVVCHGDPCAPNYLVDDQGCFTGIVDVADLGVADRWADLAVASWSLYWNFGEGYEQEFFKEYGVERDERKLRYYRLVWHLY